MELALNRNEIPDHLMQFFEPMPRLPAKNLFGIPWRVAFALQADGWYLRAACPWIKANPMVESCRDRPTTTIEWIFLLAKNPKYYWDAEAVKIEAKPESYARYSYGFTTTAGKTGAPENDAAYSCKATLQKDGQERFRDLNGRLRRSTDWFFESWQGLLMDGDGGPLAFIVNPKGVKDSHYATFPSKLVEPMILAGCPREVCTCCGKPRARIVNRKRVATRPGDNSKVKTCGQNSRMRKNRDPNRAEDRNRADDWDTSVVGNRDPQRHVTVTDTAGWTDCGHEAYRPGRVLDIFGGSGTVGYTAAMLKRDYLLIELNPAYVENIAIVRLQEAEVGLPVKEARAGQLSLFGEQG